MTHVINRLEFNLSCTSEDGAFNLRSNFTNTYQARIIDIVDRVCSKYLADDEVIQLDRLDIDLGSFFASTMDNNFDTVFANQFEKELVRKMEMITPEELSWSETVFALNLFEHFLLYGNLPWWATGTYSDISSRFSMVLQSQSTGLMAFFNKNRFNEHIWKRAALQLSAEQKQKVIGLNEILQGSKDLSVMWLDQLMVQSKNEGLNIEWSEENLVTTLLAEATGIYKAPGKATLSKILTGHLEVIYPGQAGEQKLSFLLNDIVVNSNGLENQLITKEMKDKLLQREGVLKDGKETILEKYTVKHAGIVLLAPFFVPYFEEAGLLKDKQWVNKEAQYKGVHLLKYLATGQTGLPEYEMVLEKLLCGMLIEEPVPKSIIITEKDIAESESLLTSVIGHWKLLSNTSINGLRETFLTRDGIITRREDGFLLQVERKTLDVLLESIPWGYSTINLPWNKFIIFVEW